MCEWRDLRSGGQLSELLDRTVGDLVSVFISAFREDFRLTQEDLSQSMYSQLQNRRAMSTRVTIRFS